MAANIISGKYTTFAGVPVLRENNFIVCGDNRDNYILLMMILGSKSITVDGEKKAEVPENIFCQILSTDMTIDPAKRMVKQFTGKGLMDAFDLGLEQLERYNKKGAAK